MTPNGAQSLRAGDFVIRSFITCTSQADRSVMLPRDDHVSATSRELPSCLKHSKCSRRAVSIFECLREE